MFAFQDGRYKENIDKSSDAERIQTTLAVSTGRAGDETLTPPQEHEFRVPREKIL
jgi:hypothetical protein